MFARACGLIRWCTLHFKFDGDATLYARVFGEDGRVLGVALRTTTAAVGLAPATMKTIARVWSMAVKVHRASTALLRAAAPPAVAAISLRAAAPAWREVAGLPAVVPR